MRIEDAKKAYSAQLNTLRNQRANLTKLLQESEKYVEDTKNFDRIAISRELDKVNKQYDETQSVMDRILTQEYIAYSGAAIKQQAEAAAEGAEELGKVLTIYRRIASGATVPSKDEQKLMEFSMELYMAAKSAAMLQEASDEEYDSLWEDEKPSAGDEKSPEEIAADTQVPVPQPECSSDAE